MRDGLEVLSAKSDIMKISPSNEVKQNSYCATKLASAALRRLASVIMRNLSGSRPGLETSPDLELEGLFIITRFGVERTGV